MAGKKAKCPSCGTILSIPAAAGGGSAAASVKTPPADDPFGSDPFGSGDPLAGGDAFGLGDFDDSAFATAPAVSLGSSSPLARNSAHVARKPSRSSGGSNKGLIIGLVIGGVGLLGVLMVVVAMVVFLPAVKAARDAAQQAKARNDARIAAQSRIGGGGTATTGTGPAANAWITYTWPPDRYSIMMPRQPRRQTRFHSGVQVSMASCDMGPVGAYFVAASRATMVLPGQAFDAKAALEGGVNGALANSGGKLISQKNIQLDGHPGREISFNGSSAGRSFTAYARLYVVDTTVYQTMFLGPSGSHPGADLNKFFDSFKLLDPTPSEQPETGVEGTALPADAPATSDANGAAG